MKIAGQKLTVFTVTGSGDFPFDMLRYDACWPVDTESAQGLTYGPSLEDLQRHRTVTLCSYGPGVPTVRRWASYDWRAEVRR